MTAFGLLRVCVWMMRVCEWQTDKAEEASGGRKDYDECKNDWERDVHILDG